MELLQWHKICELGGDKLHRPPVVALMKNRNVGISAPKGRIFLLINLNVRIVETPGMETLFQCLELSDLMVFKFQKKVHLIEQLRIICLQIFVCPIANT